MDWIEAKITFESDNAPLAVDLISDAFYALGANGVVVDDPLLEPEEGWGPDAVGPPDQPAVTGYLPADHRLEHRRQDLEQRLARLRADHGIRHTLSYRSVNEEEWAESWKAFFWPQEISPKLAVKPTWREYAPKPGQQVIEIDPGMAFGTGTHPTTTLCMQMIQHYLQPRNAVLDVGTGSGILLITAAKLGAGRLTGIDKDPLAVDVAGQNLDLNRIDPRSVDLHCGDLTRAVSGTYDLVVANILADVILFLLDDVGRCLKPGGIFICSGIIASREADVADKFRASGFELLEAGREEEWVALAGRLVLPEKH